MEMEMEEYDDAYADVADSSEEIKPRIYQSLSKSKTSLVIVNLLVISLVISVVSLIFTFVLVVDAQKKFEERFSTINVTLSGLRSEADAAKAEKAKIESDLQQQLQDVEADQKVLKQSLSNLSAQVSTELSISLNKAQQDLLDTIEAQQNLEESLQSLSDEVSTELSVTIQQTQQGLRSVSSQVAYYHRTIPAISCPSGYTRNPYANTCIRQVRNSKSWSQASQYCAGERERLATFETLESQYWFINLRKTSWTTSHLWIGGSRTSGRWCWDGQTSKPVTVAVWASGEPNNDDNENCIESSKDKDYKLNDESCGREYWFICEKSS